MAATVIFATLLLCLTGSELVAEAPAVQNTFIEVNLDEPNVAEKPEIATDAIPATVNDPVIQRLTETPEPIGKDVEPLDQIEPMFAEDVDMGTDAESEPVATAPLDRETQAPPTGEPGSLSLDAAAPTIVQDARVDPDAVPKCADEEEKAANSDSTEPNDQNAESMGVVPSVIVEDVQINGEGTPLVGPEPGAVQERPGEQNAAEPAAEPIQIVNPDIVPVPQAVTGAEQKAVKGSDINPSAESAGPTEPDAAPADAIQPMIIENAGNIPDPLPEVNKQTAVSPSAESTVSNEHETVEPSDVENAGIIPSPQPEPVEMPVSDPATATTSPGAEPPQVIEPVVVGEAENVLAPQNGVFEEDRRPNPESNEPVRGSSEAGEPTFIGDAENVTKHDESSQSDDGSFGSVP